MTTKTPDSQPFEGSLSAFLKEDAADKTKSTPYRLDVGKGKRVTFKRPEDIGTAEFVAVFGGGTDGMSEQRATAFFLDTMLDDADREAYLAANPSIAVTMKVIDAVHKHYEAQVPAPGESGASSD